MAALVVAIATLADAEVTGAVGLATAITAPFFAATGGNLRMLSLAGGAQAIGPLTRARARSATLLLLAMVAIVWLLAGPLDGRARIVALAVMAWRLGDLAWDESALRREVERGPAAAAPIVAGRQWLLATLVILIALVDATLGALIAILAVVYAASGGAWLMAAAWRTSTAAHADWAHGLRRALTLSLASTAVGLGVLLLRHRLSASAGVVEVGTYFSIVGPLGIIGVAATGLGLYRGQHRTHLRSAGSALLFGGGVGLLVLMACRGLAETRLPFATDGSAVAILWPELGAISFSVGLLTAATVVAALQEPLVVFRRRERHGATSEVALLMLLAVAVMIPLVPITWKGMLGLTTGWTVTRAGVRTALAAW